MAGESGGESATLETTPTWAVATVCFILIAVSILIEHGLHLLAKYLGKKRRKSLLQALNKIKSDLMLLGFISLLLTVLEKSIANICIPEGAAESFLPCKSLTSDEEDDSKCQEEGKASLMSRVAVQQLQMLIFFLAFFHVLSSFLTFSLATAKSSFYYGNLHLMLKSFFQVNFLRQFFGSVYKVDYLTLRHGFITAHFAEGSNFDFQKYLKRAFEKEFEVVVGMRLWIWIFSVLFIFFNAYVFHNYAWLPFIPLLMLLVVGTKLQSIITKMCLDSSDKSHVIRGALLVRPSDHFFWFDQPKLLLHLVHLISFQNSFQLAFFTWSWYKFGLRSCFHRETEDRHKASNGCERVVGGLKRWRAKARRNLARRNRNLALRSLDASVESSPSFATLDASPSLDIDYLSDDGAESEYEDKRPDSTRSWDLLKALI
ncbi:MLO-like protein 12 [Sesamum angolense]|uniref:MLO-like protein n=1 Tax=Sesamum angolense TaxID=2727404 RepID=A0AAE1WTC2_9LAMI|nr:MLO-like protein 12 [Sesamum angolense]